eukprot:3940627-Rhodomonas_salina.2
MLCDAGCSECGENCRGRTAASAPAAKSAPSKLARHGRKTITNGSNTSMRLVCGNRDSEPAEFLQRSRPGPKR